MTTPLDPEIKRRRGMTLAQLADDTGARKAAIAIEQEQLEANKDEFIRRNVTEASGMLFDVTMTPPGEQQRIDTAKVREVFSASFIAEHISKAVVIGWVMKCTGRKQRAKTSIAA